MRIVEHFDAVVVLGDAGARTATLVARLRAASCTPIEVDLAAPGGWRQRLAAVLEQDRGGRAAGVLLLAEPPGDDRQLWRSQDRLIEHLEARHWDIAFLGHGEGGDGASEQMPPDLVACDRIPRFLNAIALRARMLRKIVTLMPDRAVDRPLSPTDFLAIAARIAQSMLRASRPLLAWPPLVGSPREACPPAGVSPA